MSLVQLSTFKPAWWLSNPHAQTIWPSIIRRLHTPSIKLENERIELPDGDFLDLVWSEKKPGPIIIIFHGLEGSINSHYARGIMSALVKSDMNAVLMHFRGCSGVHNRLTRGYHSGETGDIKYIIQLVKKRYENRKIGAIGFSLGGNALLKYLGEYKKNTHLDAAIAVSVPFELFSCADKLNQGLSRIYQHHLIKALKKRVLSKFDQRNDAPFSLKDLYKWNTFHLFDNYVTAPLHGFKDSNEYYLLNSSRQFIKMIETPTLIIHSKDDPFTYKISIPDKSELSSPVTLELTEKGGHVGFIQGRSLFHTEYWLEKRIPAFFKQELY